MAGFYAMHRGWMDHPVLARNEPYSRREAWCWLIENAAFCDHRKRVGAAILDLQRGQVAASTRFMARTWAWEETRVRRFLTRLETAAMIAADTAAGVTVITICNYSVYQGAANDSAAPPAADIAARAPQQRRNIEEGNKGIRDKNRGASAPSDSFAWQGKVIRLTSGDYDRWKTSYPHISDISAELQAADDYYAEHMPTNGRWFFPVSNWLKKANEDAKRSSGRQMGRSAPRQAGEIF